ncbi:MAG: glycosyltransferase [Melioribacteraceae bacterium]|nr:MAG: glycosyltransferase [Melioribacteraceae bacterium]
MKPIIAIERKRVEKYESDVQKNYDRTIIITEEDRKNLPFTDKKKVEVIPNGIDEDYYIDIYSDKKYDIMFSGNLSYPPNIDAAFFLAQKIVPLLLSDHPNLRVLIVGASPNKKVLNLVSTNIVIRSWVEDIRECYASTKIYVAPMQLGTGLQNKLLEAMMMKIPCITSSLAQKGINAKIGEEILVADKPEEYCYLIKKLLEDISYSDKIAMNGQNYVKRNFNWNKITDKVNVILNSLQK